MKYTIAHGNPFDGIELDGVFDSHDEAADHAFAERYVQWWIIPINPINP